MVEQNGEERVSSNSDSDLVRREAERKSWVIAGISLGLGLTAIIVVLIIVAVAFYFALQNAGN